MEFIHLRKSDFAGSVQLTGLCHTPDGALFASGFIGLSPDLGNLLRIESTGARRRVGQRLQKSYAVVFNRSTGILLVSANDGTTPNRPSAPNGLFRITMDGSCSLVTRDVTGSGRLPLATDPAGNLYHPGIVPNTDGYSILRRSPMGDVDCIASGFRQIVGMAIDDQGDLFVADAESTLDEGVLLSVPQSGKDISVLVCEDGLRPHAVAVGKGGCVFFSNIRGANSDICEIYKVDPNGQIILVADGLVAAPGLAYDAKNDVLYALNFLNFLQGQSAIPDEYHNDTLILSITGDGQRVPVPFYQASSPVKLIPTRRSQNSSPAETTASALPRAKVSSYVAGRGPVELANKIVAWKAKLFESGLLPGLFLSDKAIERLINLAYHASCLEEEGRFPRFRMLAGTNSGGRYGVQFGPFPTYVNQAKELRKLAPATAFRGSAVVFGEEWSRGEQARLVCQGIYDTEDLISIKADAINSIEDLLTIKQPILAIRVEGPAYLKASLLPGPVFALRGGSIRPLNTMETLTGVQELFAEIGQWQHAHLPEGDDKRVRTFFGNPDVLGRLMVSMWARVLWHVSDQRRGGTFVIIPRNKGHWRHADELNIAIGYRAKINYGKALIDQVVSCLRMTPSSGPGYGDIFRLTWDRSRGERERMTRMVADLANVDGCVVLDRRLNVIGFGAKITLPVEHMEGFGTRHGSAKAWCARHDGGMAFVVSQDGDLRIFSSDASSSPEVVDAGASILEFC